MSDSREEIENRLTACQEKNQCKFCNAQIHLQHLTRTHKVGVGYDDTQRHRVGKV
jgi:hypothetical protein